MSLLNAIVPGGEEWASGMDSADPTGNVIRTAIDTLARYHSQQIELCSQLEVIADALPDSVNTQVCLLAARAVYPEIKRGHDFEEDILFPMARELAKNDDSIPATLERLRYEHWEDESYAQEITDALMSYVTEPEHRNADKLSYMLRGFFEGLRRHIAFEQEHLVPLLLDRAERKQ